MTILPVADIEKNWVTPVEAAGRKLAVYDTPEGVFVTTALCSHTGADLCQGYFSGTTIECPLHQGLFDVRSGDPVAAPVTRPIKRFEARVMDGFVQIKTG